MEEVTEPCYITISTFMQELQMVEAKKHGLHEVCVCVWGWIGGFLNDCRITEFVPTRVLLT